MTKVEFFDLLERKLQDAPEEEKAYIRSRYEELFRMAAERGEPEELTVQRLLEPDEPEPEPQPEGPTTVGGDRYDGLDDHGGGGPSASPNSFDAGYGAEPGGHDGAGPTGSAADFGGSAGFDAASDYTRHDAPGGYDEDGGTSRRSGESTLRLLAVGTVLALFNLVFVLAPFVAIASVLFSAAIVGVVLLAVPVLYPLLHGLPADRPELLFLCFSGAAIFGLGLTVTVLVSYVLPKFIELVRAYVRWNVKTARGD